MIAVAMPALLELPLDATVAVHAVRSKVLPRLSLILGS